MERGIIDSLDCNDKTYLEVYNRIFTLEWYPKLFVKDIYDIFYIDSYEFLVEFISNITLHSNDKIIYLRVKNFLEDCGYKCYSIPSTKIELMQDDIIYQTALYTMDEGFVIFGDSSKWAIYFGEDLYDYGRTADFREFSFVFGTPCIRKIITDFFKEKYSNNFYINKELKNKYFQTHVDSQEKITTFSLNITP